MCTLFAKKVLKYNDGGVTSLTNHVKRKSHVSKWLDTLNYSLLPRVSNPIKTNHMYGATPLFHNVPKSKPSTIVRPSAYGRSEGQYGGNVGCLPR